MLFQPGTPPRSQNVVAVGLGTTVLVTEQKRSVEWRHQQNFHLEERQTVARVGKAG